MSSRVPPTRPSPPSSGVGQPNSVKQTSMAPGDWPDDETFVGDGIRPVGRTLPTMTAQTILEEKALAIPITILAGADGIDRVIDHTRIQKSGLALAGHFHGIVATRIQILGQTEQSFVNELDAASRRRALRGFFGLGLSAVILTGQLGPSTGEIMAAAEETQTPLLHAGDRSSVTISALHSLLDERLAPRQRLHGVLIDVFGVGLLIMGSSGVGKSECALDLVMRGHRLVADDVVECDYRPPGMVFGAPAQLLRHHLEVRGLGILNIKDLFGVTAIRERKRIDVVVRLSEDNPRPLRHPDEPVRDLEFDRLGLDERFHTILGVPIPELAIPVRPGRDMASILEVAARNELLKNAGHHAARELFGAIESSIQGAEAAAAASTPSPGDAQSGARAFGKDSAKTVPNEPPPSSETGGWHGGVLDRSGIAKGPAMGGTPPFGRMSQSKARNPFRPANAVMGGPAPGGAATSPFGKPIMRAPMVSENEIVRPYVPALTGRSDESGMPPPVGGGPTGSPPGSGSSPGSGKGRGR